MVCLKFSSQLSAHVSQQARLGVKIVRLRSTPRTHPPFYLQDTFSTAVKPLPANRPSRSLPPLLLSNSTTQSAPFWNWGCCPWLQVGTKHTWSSGLNCQLAFSLYCRLKPSRLRICVNSSSLFACLPDFWSSLLPRTWSFHFSSSAYFLTRRIASLDLRGWHEAKERNPEIQREPEPLMDHPTPLQSYGIGHNYSKKLCFQVHDEMICQ